MGKSPPKEVTFWDHQGFILGLPRGLVVSTSDAGHGDRVRFPGRARVGSGQKCHRGRQLAVRPREGGGKPTRRSLHTGVALGCRSYGCWRYFASVAASHRATAANYEGGIDLKIAGIIDYQIGRKTGENQKQKE
ncbi:hypothetical protein AAFF_G00073500 [Aldrovandia affinis]|uniref:Uncharacterized protein n=1 Tax=Aldrovandia affinis TaxID=143900 RepID=A0AAD7S117_9TELE|nr:hypothetical protein AAFF_G00073500 [Aldrovandia affinis]